MLFYGFPVSPVITYDSMDNVAVLFLDHFPAR